MVCSDPIADLLTRIRNGLTAKHRYVDLPWSKMKESVANILQKHGLVQRVLVKKEKVGSTMRVILKYSIDQKPSINGLKRFSKPGCRRYVKHDEIPHYFGGMGLSILSTSKGVLSGFEAKREKVGGELLCLVW